MKIDRIIEIPSELGAGTRGASLGINALKLSAAEKGLTFLANVPQQKVKDENDLLFKPSLPENAHYIRGIYTVMSLAADVISDACKLTDSMLILTGDHSNAIATLAGIRKARPNDRLGVIWIDAHADMHTPYTSPSGNIHGMPLAASLGFDNKECIRHDPTELSKEYWEKLKNMGGISPKILPDDLVFLGLRSFEAEEKFLLEKYDIARYNTGDIRKMGLARSIAKTLEHLRHCDRIHISFDVDSMDPTVSRGTGTPVEGGLFPDEVIELLKGLSSDERVRTLEITEINPLLDNCNKMAKTVLQILTEVIK